jgi:hypothetical protein
MDGDILEDIARQLSAVEVALFLCLASRTHCLIETTGGHINDLAKELALVKNAYGLLRSLSVSEQYLLTLHTDILEHIRSLILHC